MDNNLNTSGLRFDEIDNIESYVFLCGLNFPKGVSDFQKSMLVMAHLTAICRESIMRGNEIPQPVVELIGLLNWICEINVDEQTCVDIPLPENK